jgi:integrase/recombinase XerD
MKLHEAVTQYVTYKQSLGMRFATEARTLKSFCRSQAGQELAQITAEAIETFIAGHGPPTRFCLRKHEALHGFYRFAIAHGYAERSPLPKSAPKIPDCFIPYIFSHAELKRLLEATDACFEVPRCRLDAATYRVLLLLLYGAALRISEALSLTLADVDLDNALLHIHESKFYRTRLVPIGIDLCAVLSRHLNRRRTHGAKAHAPLFVSRAGDRLTRRAADHAFCRLRTRAKVLRHDGGRFQPRLHDLRHTSATHRLLSWYQSGADVQRLLPQLATYLGHIHIVGTQRYLTLTPQLLEQAGRRFERYAFGGCHD